AFVRRHLFGAKYKQKQSARSNGGDGAVAGSEYDKPQTLENRQTMVHLLEWKWPDIATECETFLQHYGYGAVQVRNCRLDALADLNQGSPGVRKKLVAFLDRLIDYGVAASL
ncbi:hypothetical protein OSTOST_20832, partial [Ostertagia ostertagi]